MSEQLTFTTVTGGNRRAINRKLARLLGESLPRMRQATRYRATHVSAFILPDACVTVPKPNATTRRDDDNLQSLATRGAQQTVRPYYRPHKRVIPDHEKPSKVVVTKLS